MFGIDLQSLILDAIPIPFWVGVLTGGVIVGMLGASLWWMLNFMLRHWKAILLLCAVIIAVSVGLIAL